MKKSFLLLSSALLAGLLVSCGNNPGGQGGDGIVNSNKVPQPGDYGYQAPLEKVDIASLKNELIIHYNLENEGPDRSGYNGWRAWMWADGKEGKEYNPNAIDDFGSIFHYSLESLTGLTDKFAAGKIGFIIKTPGDGAPWAGSVTKDGEADRFIDLSLFSPDSNGNYEIWVQSGISTLYNKMPTSRDAIGTSYFYDEAGATKVFVTTIAGKMKHIDLKENGQIIDSWDFKNPTSSTPLDLSNPVSLSSSYSVSVTFDSGVVLDSPVSFYPLFNTKTFREAYDYDGALGVELTANATTFRVWSPMSTSIKVRVYQSGTPKKVNALKGDDTILHEVELVKGEKGVFSATINEDLSGKYYTFVVNNGFYKDKEIVDPYARSAGINGLRGMIVDFSKTNPEGWEQTTVNAYDRKELAVYETHVRDVTSSSTWTGTEANRGKYLGLIEPNTSFTKDGKTTKTGFDYLKSLGFNALQLMPFFDQANNEEKNDYNWGYNPLNYNVLEGAYSSDPYDGYARIREFKKVVKAFTDAGINIIMDVVYNHVNSVAASNFDVLMPGYYFRYVQAGQALSNGSGCGNETASNHTMMRKFIVDSVKFLAEEYKLGGFRFDLMALEDITTMNLVASTLKSLNPSIAVYGEPWTGGTSALGQGEAASQANGNKYVGYGQFNDGMRDALIKGGMKGKEEIGFVTAKDGFESKTSSLDRLAITMGLAGHTKSTGTIRDADKTTNYVTCHDNYTLADRFDAAAKANKEKGLVYTEEEKKAMNVLANSFVFTSLGTAFMNAGEEFNRTKGGSHNSYGGDPLTPEMIQNGYDSWTKVNELDYSLAIKNADMVETYKTMIRNKVSNPDFALASVTETNPITTVVNEKGLIVVDLQGAKNTYRIAYRNAYSGNQTVDFTGFKLDWATVKTDVALTENTEILPYQTIVAVK